MIITVLFSLAVSLLMFIIPGTIGMGIGADSETIDGLTSYLRAMSFGITAQMLAAQFSVFLQLEQQEKRTYTGIAIMAVSNVTLNILFVKVFDMGLFGLGLSTTVSSWLFCIVQATYYFGSKASIRFSMKDLDLSYLKDMIRIRIPGAVVQFCLTIRGLALNKIILGYAGNEAPTIQARSIG